MSTASSIKTFGKPTSTPDSEAVADQTLEPIQVDQVMFDQVKAFLSTKDFKDSESLDIMALILADIHKKSGTPLDQLITAVDAGDVVTLSNKALSLVNKLRPKTSQVGIKVSRLATRPYIKRNILA